jgi:hypothetical protein
MVYRFGASRPRGSTRPWALPVFLTAVIAIAAVPTVADAKAATMSAPPCATRQVHAAAAAAMAQRCGHRVEALSERSEHAQVFANTDGTMTLEQSVTPRWVRRGGTAWAPVDTTLRRAGAAVEPVATAVPVSFSAGGDGRLAQLADGPRRLALTWPSALPAPTLAGDSATYREVLPGVDLRVTATATGFSKVLVIKHRQAAAQPALAAVRFGLETDGVSVSAAKGGGLEARDGTGRVVFTSPAPVMWDSAGTATGLPRTAAVGERLEPGAVTVIPDRAFLTDPAVKYPVFLDPSWTGWWYMWKIVANRADLLDSSTFTLNNGPTRGTVASGRTCDESTSNGTCLSPQYNVRSMFRMDISGARGKHLLRATFNILQRWSWTCSPATQAKLWLTGGISSSTTWRSQPNWDGAYTATAFASHRAGGGNGCADTGTVSFDATHIVAVAYQNGWSDITLGLRAIDEGSLNQWKRFDGGTATLSLVYNSAPNLPDALTVQGQACATGSGRPVVAVGSPVLSARVTDPDGAGEGDIGGSLRADFTWERRDPSSGTWSSLGSGSGVPQAGGATSPSTAPSFASGDTYRWQVRAANPWSFNNTSGTDYSAWTDWCEFDVDTVKPNPPRLTPDPTNQPFVTGRTIRLSLAPGGSPADTDLTGYSWWVVDGAGTHAPAFVSGTGAAIDWTPIAGQGTIHVQAKDRVQVGTASTYTFNAAQPSTEVVRWRLDDPAGSTIAADATGYGHNATTSINAGSTLGAPGRLIGGPTSLSLAGNSWANGAAPVDTSRSFTVAAWVKLTDTSGSKVAVSVAGPVYGSFYLMYHRDYDRFAVSTPVLPTNPSPWKEAYSSSPPTLGVWTHLTGVYDSAAGHLRLYVDGRLTGTATDVDIWTAPGPFHIGEVKGGGSRWMGGLADVRVWDRVVSAADIVAMSDPLAGPDGGNVGQWRMDEGSGSVAYDSSDYFHDVNLNVDGGVTWTTASQSGPAALSFDGTGEAHTDGPVIHTDQSFTVSAWARLADADPGSPGPNLPTGNRNVIGQSGSRVSAFYLGYRIDAGVARWAFSFPDSDTDFGDDPNAAGAWVTAFSATALTTADIGRWVHLIGVYDAQTGAIHLYVDGALAGSATRTGLRWDATGQLTVGTALWTGTWPAPRLVDHWIGSIDNVHVFQGAVPAGSVGLIP